MNDMEQVPLSDTEQKITEAAIGVFLRYGAKKTTMADVAAAAGVSRQTVYATFGDKDGIIVACIRSISEASQAAIRLRLASCETLEERLQVYFEETVIKSFEMLQTAGDPEELISGHNQAGKVAIQESHTAQAGLVAEFLAPYSDTLACCGQSPKSYANFIVSVAMGLKYGLESREELDALLGSLTTSASAIVKPG